METQNTFAKMLISDASPLNAGPDLLTASQHIEFLSNGKDEFILQNTDGTEYIGSLNTGFVPIGIGTFNKVAYIVSYNPLLNLTEIGSFPSPEPFKTEGKLQYQYLPLQNFKTGNSYGAFQSTKFGYSLNQAVRVEVQPAFDGTVNLILQDTVHPEIMVNTRFSVTDNMEYRIVDRSGVDSNLYDENSFGSTLNLFSRSPYLMGCEFVGLEIGGQAKLGNYRFFVRYSTQDGNETDVMAETFPISVIYGKNAKTLRGGKNNEPSDKRVHLRMTNLDPVYPFLRIYYTYAAGDMETTVLAYQLRQLVPTRGAKTLDFYFSGIEESLPVGETSLSLAMATLDHFQGMAQINNQLVLVGGQEKSRDTDLLANFAKHITIGHKEVKMHAPGYNSDLLSVLDTHLNEDLLSTTPVVDNNIKKPDILVGAPGGYLNPWNANRYAGYMGGEATPFSVKFIFTDGTMSPAYPCMGIDNVTNGQQLNTLYPNHQGLVDTVSGPVYNGWLTANGTNVSGIYRFPNRNSPGVPPILTNQIFSVNGVTFQIPELTRTVYEDIRKFTIGVQFFRGERKPDAIAQGYLIPTVSVLKERDDTWTYKDHVDTAYGTLANLKFVPALRGGLEGIHKERTGNGSYNKYGIFPVWFYRLHTAGNDILSLFRYAFLSCDVLGDPDKMGDILNQRVQRTVKILSVAIAQSAARVRWNTVDNNENQYVPSVYVATNMYNPSPQFDPNKKADLSWVPAYSDNFNQGQFSSHAKFAAKLNDTDKVEIDINFNSYVGVVFKNQINPHMPINITSLSDQDGPAASDRDSWSGGQNYFQCQVGFLANIYKDQGQLKTSDLPLTYSNISTIRYTPISPRLYWKKDAAVAGSDDTNSLESLLDTDRKLLLFGGDIYIATAMRRLYTNSYWDTSKPDAYNAGIGTTVQICNESIYNPAWRHPQTEDANELFTAGYDRTFAPYVAQDEQWYWDDYKLNSFRRGRLRETSGSNRGYSYRSSAIIHIADSPEAPFRANMHPNRVYVTEPYNPSAFVNGYRTLLPLSSRDYNLELGPITTAHSSEGRLVLVHEKGISSMGLNERIEAGKDSTGVVYAEPGSTLPPVARRDSSEFGSTWGFSTCVSDSFVYGVDVNSHKIWQHNNQGAVTLISDQSIQGFLKQWTSAYIKVHQKICDYDIRSQWDRLTGNVYFNFYMKNAWNFNYRVLNTGRPSDWFNNGNCFTLVYSETMKVWNCTNAYRPLLYFSALDNFYSFPLTAPYERMFQHGVKVTSAGQKNCGNFYGTDYPFYFEFIVRGKQIAQVFDTLEMGCSPTYPAWLELTTADGTYKQMIRHTRSLRTDNAHYRKGRMYIELENRIRRNRLEEEYLRIRVGYETRDKVFINLIKTHHRESYT